MSSKTKTPATKKEAMATLVPKLRFPEFGTTGGWAAKTLGSVAKISTEKVGDNICIPMSITSGVGLVSQMEKFGRIIAGSSYANYLQLKKNDFAYNKSATKEYPEGFIALYTGNELAAVPNSIFTCFRVTGDSPVPQYLNYLFFGNLHGKWLRKFIEVGARAHGSLSINEDDLLALPVPLPSGKSSVREQQKIAGCLSSVDELLAAQARLRFPEFRNDGTWESDTLENLCRAKISYGIVQAGPHVPNGMPYIKSTDLNSQLSLSKLSRTSDIIAQKYRRSEVLPGDIVFSLRGNIGVAQIVPREIPVANLTQGTARIRPEGSAEFYFYSLQSQSVHGRILAVSKGSTFQEISLDALRNIKVMRPGDGEQQCIASCLGSLDALIMAEGQKLEALKTHKKGLMQQLFPSPEEVEA